MSKVEGGEGPITPPPLKASCNYFFFEASRVKNVGPYELINIDHGHVDWLIYHARLTCQEYR